jgi:putative peptidoglycan lipid II flippase
MSQMLKASGAMAAATMTSRVLGMVREMVYAAFMGNTWVASAFILAFQVPNLFRRLLGEGALTAAFIPIFKKKQIQEGEPEMWRSANAVISGLAVGAGAVVVLAVLGISVALAAREFRGETRLMLELLRFMFPYMLLACLAAVLIGMANARGHFFVPAMGAVLLNVIMIGSVLLLAPRMGQRLDQQIFGLAIGVLVAGLAQAFFQLPTLAREGFRFQWVSPWNDPTVGEVVRKMLPGSIGVAAFQINVLLTQTFSFWVDKSIVSTFNYSVRLMEMPQGMFGISLATYLLPTLAGLASEKKYDEFRGTLRQGLTHIAFTNLFAAGISIALAEPIVRLLFERGEFHADATYRVAMALSWLAPGLLMFSVNNILGRAFYALNDIKTPMRISVFCLLLNLMVGFSLVWTFKESGLAAANSFTAFINTALLLYALRRKLKYLGLEGYPQTLGRIALAALVAGLVALGIRALWEAKLGSSTLPVRIGAVLVPGGIAGAIYLVLSLWFKVPTATDMLNLALRRTRGI